MIEKREEKNIKKLNIVKSIILFALGALSFYWYIMYSFEKKNSYYEKISSQNINNEEKLLDTLQEWNNWFNSQKLYVDRRSYEFSSLKYSILLTFINKKYEERLIIYRNVRSKNFLMSKIDRLVTNLHTNTIFRALSFDMSKYTAIKKENVCYMYQKYVIDVAVYPDEEISEYEEYCDGLIIPKKFTEEEIQEKAKIDKGFESLRP